MAISQKDIEKLSSVFATKDELKVVINKITEFKHDVLNGQDEILKKLDDLRTEKLILTGQYRRHDDSIANHEERIVRLENKVLV